MSSSADPAGLHSLLARAAAAGLSARRSKACMAPEDALWFFVDSVQSTILPRQLKVFIDDRVCLTVVANGGRLIEILDSQDDYGLGLSPRMLNTPDLPEICDALQQLFAGAGHIAIVPLAAEADPNAALHGIRGLDLMQALGGVPTPWDRSARLDDLITAAQDVTLAIWHPFDTPSVTADGFDVSEPLRDWIVSVFAALVANDDTEGDELLYLLHAPRSPSLTGCFHLAGPTQTAILIHRDAATDVAEYWATMR